uniref:Uncharacterized protein n=1 Tax=viral metagenome TaxID=1070528 RepID=A0A6C0M0D3_9ZZZZ
MDVSEDIPAVPLTEEQIQIILDAHEPRDEVISVPTSVGFGHEGRFILPGDTQEYKEYTSAQEMIADQPPLPDPVFNPGDVTPLVYDAGASLQRLESYAVEFSKLVDELFATGKELKYTKEGMDVKIAEYEAALKTESDFSLKQ